MYGSLISLMPKTQPLLLNLYPNASIAYSLRKLRVGYNGNVIRVRRNVDNLEKDFGFDSYGNLDTNAVINSFGNNLLLQSENFENASWTKLNSVVTANSILAPNDIDLSCKFNENTTSGFHLLTASQFGTLLGRDYLFAIYLKAGERNIIDFVSLVDATNTCRLNLTTGSIVSNNFANTPTLTDVGNGWWKFELIVNASNTVTSTGFQLRLTNGSTQSYIGNNGWGCYLWGAQVSGYSGSIVPYFRTTTVSASNSSVVTWYDQSGNGRDIIKGTILKQPNIIFNGHVTYENSKPSITYNDDLFSSSAYLATQVNNLTLIQVIRITTLGSTNPRYSAINNSVLGINVQFGITTAINRYFVRRNNIVRGSDTTYTTTGNRNILVNGVSSNVNYFARNGVSSTMNNIPTIADESFLGNGFHTLDGYNNNTGTKILTGTIQEVILYDFDQTTKITEIQNKINEYYGIY
jgi:hypothetical protein